MKRRPRAFRSRPLAIRMWRYVRRGVYNEAAYVYMLSKVFA
jgi:hypothetical protein